MTRCFWRRAIRIGWWKAWFSLTPSLILDGSCARVSFCSWTRSICSDKSCRALLWAIISQTIQVEMMLIEPRNICYGDSTKLTEHTWTYIHISPKQLIQQIYVLSSPQSRRQSYRMLSRIPESYKLIILRHWTIDYCTPNFTPPSAEPHTSFGHLYLPLGSLLLPHEDSHTIHTPTINHFLSDAPLLLLLLWNSCWR